MKTFEPPRTLEMGGDGNGLYPPGDEKGRSYKYSFWLCRFPEVSATAVIQIGFRFY